MQLTITKIFKKKNDNKYWLGFEKEECLFTVGERANWFLKKLEIDVAHNPAA